MLARGLNDCFTEGGFWWREGNKENEVAGTLAFDPEACHVLRLFGMLHDVVRLRSPPINPVLMAQALVTRHRPVRERFATNNFA